MDDQNKNLLLASVLSFAVIFIWYVLFPQPDRAPDQVPPVEQVQDAQTGTTAATASPATAPTADGSTVVVAATDQAGSSVMTRDEALAQTPRIVIDTKLLSGSISLEGGRIDDLHLNKYNVTLDPDSGKVTLLSPANTEEPYYAVYGWVPAAGVDASQVPNAKTMWQVESGTTVTDTTPVVLKWDNGAGLVFRRTISVDSKYMFTIRQSVENTTGTAVQLQPYGIIARVGKPKVIGRYILHEGVVRDEDGQIQEIKYKAMPDEPFVPAEGGNVNSIDVQNNGWIGFTDKNWMTTLIPQPGQPFTSVSKYTPATDTYQTDMRLPVMQVAPGQTAEISTMLFAGAKEVSTIKAYQKDLGIEKFVDSVDWGMFFFLTKPIFALLEFIYGLTGNMGWAIIGLTLTIKALLFPLAYKSYVSMSKMKKLQPEMAALKERAGKDKAMLQKETMELYKRNKVNPASGCLPIFLQIPIFFSLYKVLFVTIEMRHAPFIGWIKDLSAPDPTSILNLFGLLPYTPPGPESAIGILSLGVLPILLGISMWLQQKLNPAPTEKAQAMIFAYMPWVFMFMLGKFASGLVVYWVANNTITFTQQYLIMRSQGVKPDIFGNIMSSFKRDKAK